MDIISVLNNSNNRIEMLTIKRTVKIALNHSHLSAPMLEKNYSHFDHSKSREIIKRIYPISHFTLVSLQFISYF